MQLEQINATEFEQLIAGGRVVETHPLAGAKVLIHDAQNTVVKIFYRPQNVVRLKYLFYKQRFQRFADNAQELLARKVTAPKMLGLYRYHSPEFTADILHYEKIPGIDLRVLLKESKTNLMDPFIAFWAHLHEQGIFFRGIHLGNIIEHHLDFGLVDIEDCHFYNRPLSLYVRGRNIAHVFKRTKDRPVLPPIDAFMSIYFQSAKLNRLQQNILTPWVKLLLGHYKKTLK